MHHDRRVFNLLLLSLLALSAGSVDGSGVAGRLTAAFLGPSSLCNQRHHSTVASFLPSLPWSSCPPTTAAAAAAGGRRTATLSPPAATITALARVRGGGSGSQLAALPTTEQLAALATGPVGVGLGTNTALALLGVAVKQRWLTPSGLLHAWVLGVALWSTLGWRGWLVCVLYLVFGSLVTKVKQKEKEAKGIAEKRGGARGPENVWGSAAAGTLCALAAAAQPALAPVMRIGYVASLATKLSDTFASEIGKAYGKRTFLITTLQPVPPGTEGAVSLEGTLAGVVGSVIMTGAGVVLGVVGSGTVPLVLTAAFVATNIESLLGVWLQNDKYPWATNEFINFLNTLIGAAVAVGVTLATGK